MMINAMVPRDMCCRRRTTAAADTSRSITLPLFHATAQTVQMNAYCIGGTLVLLPRFDPAALLTAMPGARRCTGSACRRCTGRC